MAKISRHKFERKQHTNIKEEHGGWVDVRTIADSGIRTACGGNHRQRKRELEQVALPLYTPEDLPTLALAMDPNLGALLTLSSGWDRASQSVRSATDPSAVQWWYISLTVINWAYSIHISYTQVNFTLKRKNSLHKLYTNIITYIYKIFELIISNNIYLLNSS